MDEIVNLMEIRGNVENIIYRNEENGYCVASVVLDDGGETAAITEPKRADSARVSPKRRGQTAQRPVFRSKRAQRT